MAPCTHSVSYILLYNRIREDFEGGYLHGYLGLPFVVPFGGVKHVNAVVECNLDYVLEIVSDDGKDMNGFKRTAQTRCTLTETPVTL